MYPRNSNRVTKRNKFCHNRQEKSRFESVGVVSTRTFSVMFEYNRFNSEWNTSNEQVAYHAFQSPSTECAFDLKTLKARSSNSRTRSSTLLTHVALCIILSFLWCSFSLYHLPTFNRSAIVKLLIQEHAYTALCDFIMRSLPSVSRMYGVRIHISMPVHGMFTFTYT